LIGRKKEQQAKTIKPVFDFKLGLEWAGRGGGKGGIIIRIRIIIIIIIIMFFYGRIF
jgi:hypothetical protein